MQIEFGKSSRQDPWTVQTTPGRTTWWHSSALPLHVAAELNLQINPDGQLLERWGCDT